MNRYIILMLCVLAISFGQVLFKLAANISRSHDSFWMLATEPLFIAAITLYGITTLGWVWCLQEVPLGRAYLFMSLAYVFVPVLSWLFFSEVLTWKYFVSLFLIIAGIGFSLCS